MNSSRIVKFMRLIGCVSVQSESDSNSDSLNGFINCNKKYVTDAQKSCRSSGSEEPKTPAFLTKKEVYEWIRTRKKTIELRRGKPQNGERIAFLNGRNESVKGRILRKQEGTFEDVLNAATYKKIIPPANNLDEARAFVKQIYPQTGGVFTTYEFELDQKK